jgi:ribose 5-phosphate isomerase RpiB
MGGRLIGPIVAVETLEAWLTAEPQSRHDARIEKLTELDDVLKERG